MCHLSVWCFYSVDLWDTKYSTCLVATKQRKEDKQWTHTHCLIHLSLLKENSSPYNQYIRLWPSGLLRRVVFWLCTSVSEEHTVSIFKVERRVVRVLMGYNRGSWRSRQGAQEDDCTVQQPTRPSCENIGPTIRVQSIVEWSIAVILTQFEVLLNGVPTILADVQLLGEITNIIRTQTLLDACKEVGVDSVSKLRENQVYMLMSRHQNIVQNHDITVGHK
jgi:hypothetical protein